MNHLIENQKEDTKPKGQSGRVSIWLNRGIACLLLFAAGMKAWQLATVPVLGEGLLHARWFNILVVEFELAFALWLLFGFLPKLTRWATIGLFSIFAGVSLYKALSGEASCGCFGAATVNPWWTTTLDVTIVGFLIAFQSYTLETHSLQETQFVKQTRFHHQLGVYIYTLCLMGGLILYGILHEQYSRLSEVGHIIGSSKIIEINPQAWVGRMFPLRDYCILDQCIYDDSSFVMLRRNGCADCERLWPGIVQLVREKKTTLAVLDMSNDQMPEDSREHLHPTDIRIVYGRASPEYIWYVETPIVLELHQGIVYQVYEKKDFLKITNFIKGQVQ